MRISWIVFSTILGLFTLSGCSSDQQQQGQQEDLETDQQGEGEGEDGAAENQFDELGNNGLEGLANAAAQDPGVNEVGLDQVNNGSGGFGGAGGAPTNGLDPSTRVVRYVISDGTPVYPQPSTDGQPIMTLVAGDALMVTVPGDGWAQIAEGRFVQESSLSETIVPRTRAAIPWTNTPPESSAQPVDPNGANAPANGLNQNVNPFNQSNNLGNGLNNQGANNPFNQGSQENFGNSQQLDQAELGNQSNSENNQNQNENQNYEQGENNENYQQQEEYDE